MNAAFVFILHLFLLLTGIRSSALQPVLPATGTELSATVPAGMVKKAPAAAGQSQVLIQAGHNSQDDSLSNDLSSMDTEDEDECDHLPYVLFTCCLVALATAGLLAVRPRPYYARPSYHKHFSFTGTDRYVALCVFRI